MSGSILFHPFEFFALFTSPREGIEPRPPAQQASALSIAPLSLGNVTRHAKDFKVVVNFYVKKNEGWRGK